MPSATLIVGAVLMILAITAPRVSYAQTDAESAFARVNLSATRVNIRTSQNLFAAVEQEAPGIRRYLATTHVAHDVQRNRTEWSANQATAARRQRSVGRKIVGGILGGVGGFFGGGYLGAAIEGDRCNCDDPGLMGALIGAPIGATVGAILGVKFF
jgi:hypothetical protein